MSDIDDPGRRRDLDAGETAREAETPVDPAYASGSGFTGDATAAAPAASEATAGPDPIAASAAAGAASGSTAYTAPTGSGGGGMGGGATVGAAPPMAESEDRTLAIVTHALNIAGPFTGGLGNLGAIILAYVKKDAAPAWLQSHYLFAIRTVWIALIVSVLLCVVAFIAVPLSFIGVGLLLFPLVGLGFLALSIWIVVRSVVALLKVLENQPYPTPQSYLL